MCLHNYNLPKIINVPLEISLQCSPHTYIYFLMFSVHKGLNSLVLIASNVPTQHAAIRATAVLLIRSFAYETGGVLEKRVTLMKSDLIKRYRANVCVWVFLCARHMKNKRDEIQKGLELLLT